MAMVSSFPYMPLEKRLLDFLEDIAEAGSDDEFDDESDGPVSALVRQESSHGPLHWNTRCSAELQTVIDAFRMNEVYELDFSVTIADPMQPDCPLVACSEGFTQLTGYTVQEIVGRNCRFLLNGVPSNYIDEDTRFCCRSFCLKQRKRNEMKMSTVEENEDEQESEGRLPVNLQKQGLVLPEGELCCVQTNARKSGQLFRNMFYLKQVELDDRQYILGLQAGLPDTFDECDMEALEGACSTAFLHLDQNMAAIEQILASKFWYSAPMRRQLTPGKPNFMEA